MLFAHAKTKAHINCAVSAQLISAFVFATWIVPKLQVSSVAIFYRCTAQIVLDLVGNTGDRFSHDAAHNIYNYFGKVQMDRI